jgi:hypothetical protein
VTILSKPGDTLLTICAWHADFRADDPLNANASHGICPACVARVFGDDDLTRSGESALTETPQHAASSEATS